MLSIGSTEWRQVPLTWPHANAYWASLQQTLKTLDCIWRDETCKELHGPTAAASRRCRTRNSERLQSKLKSNLKTLKNQHPIRKMCLTFSSSLKRAFFSSSSDLDGTDNNLRLLDRFNLVENSSRQRFRRSRGVRSQNRLLLAALSVKSRRPPLLRRWILYKCNLIFECSCQDRQQILPKFTIWTIQRLKCKLSKKSKTQTTL